MQISVSSTLTLYHDGQFWVGIIEHVEDERLGIARIVFGAEPSDEEILEFVVNRWEHLSFYGSKDPDMPKVIKNPKRRMREAAKSISGSPASTKAQQALAEQRESLKEQSAHRRSSKKNEKKQERFELREAKRKQKHRGH